MWHRILTRSSFHLLQIKTPSSSLPPPPLFKLIKSSVLCFSTNRQEADFPEPSSNLNPSLLCDIQTITSSLEKQCLEECKVKLSQDLVTEGLARLRNDWDAAYSFFRWTGKQLDYAHSVRDYHSMVAILGKFRRFDTAWSLVEEMRAKGLVMPHTIFILIRR